MSKHKKAAPSVESSNVYISANTKKVLNIIQVMLAGVIIITSIVASFYSGVGILIEAAFFILLIYLLPIAFMWIIGRI